MDVSIPARHRAGEPAITTIPRRDIPALIALMLEGKIDPAPGGPILDARVLLAATAPQEQAKLHCLREYLRRVAIDPPQGSLTIERIVVGPYDWLSDRSPLGPFDVRREGSIEDAVDCRQVDFANSFLGGGVLTGGCVQEEIRFAVAPELLAGMIVSPRMGPLEAIVLRGAERYALTSGYAFSLRYAGPFHDPHPDVELVAIDAIDHRKPGVPSPFEEAAMRRELDKARAGFRRDARNLTIATGNWGCGVFGGDPALKAILQWLAASAEGRAIRYFTFGDKRLGDLEGLVSRVKHLTVGELARKVLAARKGGEELYRAL
jgi:poly(ADP-ribose) glycohydrolase